MESVRDTLLTEDWTTFIDIMDQHVFLLLDCGSIVVRDVASYSEGF